VLVGDRCLVMEAIAGQWGAGGSGVAALPPLRPAVECPDADRHRALLEALQSGRIPMAGLEQSLERRRARHSSSTSLAGHGTQRCACLSATLEARIRTQNGHWPGNWRTLSRAGSGDGPSLPGGQPNLIRLEAAAVQRLPAAMAPALQRPTAFGLSRPAWIDGRSPSPGKKGNNDTKLQPLP